LPQVQSGVDPGAQPLSVADLPVSGRPVVLWLSVRPFYYDHVDCTACTFVDATHPPPIHHR